jgi:hypothetical protein
MQFILSNVRQRVDEIQLFNFQATIVRSQKDTAHTKAERNILEAVKVPKNCLQIT